MNKIFRVLIHVPSGIIKMVINRLLRGRNFHGSCVCAVSPLSEISLDRGGKLRIGRAFRMRDGAKLRVRKGGECVIGKNVAISASIVTCHDKIIIGDNVQIAPNVQIYDHDHDYQAEGGIASLKYKTSPVVIGNNCWIAANTVILRGTVLGDNCVVGAGCVLKGEYPEGSVLVQKRVTTIL